MKESICYLLAILLGTSVLRAESADNPYEYDISAFTNVATALVRYTETAAIAPGVKSPHALAVHSAGRWLVAGDGEAALFDPDGGRRSRFAIPGKAGCAAFLPGGEILIGVGDHVERFSRDGKPADTWVGMGESAVLTSVAAMSNLVFLADAGNRVVWRFDEDGRLLGQIGAQDAGDGAHHFVVPSPYFDVVAARGRVWVANPGRARVEEYTAQGAFVGQWGQSGMQIEKFCGCCNPIHLTLAADGAFVTAEKGLARVKVYGTNGDLESVVASAELFPAVGMSCTIAASISDIAVDARGRVLVLDATGALRVFVRKP